MPEHDGAFFKASQKAPKIDLVFAFGYKNIECVSVLTVCPEGSKQGALFRNDCIS